MIRRLRCFERESVKSYNVEKIGAEARAELTLQRAQYEESYNCFLRHLTKYPVMSYLHKQTWQSHINGQLEDSSILFTCNTGARFCRILP